VELTQFLEAGVTVRQTLTDQAGKYEFFDILGGEYTLSASFSGYQLFSMDLTLSGVSGQYTVPTVHLMFDYCGTTPACSGHGSCGSGTACVCDAGWTGISCESSILPAECANHRGFTEDVLDNILISSALQKNYDKLSALYSSLQSLSAQLPAYQSNSCCGGSDGFTYPVDVSAISTESYSFLQGLMQFHDDSESFFEEFK